MVGPVGGGFVAAEELVDVFAGGFLEREGEAAVLVHEFELIFEGIGVDYGDFEVEEGDFDGVDAHHLPHIEGEESDEVFFGFIDGVVAVEVAVEVGVVGLFVLVVDDDLGGAKAVDHFGGFHVAFAFGGGGSEGFGSVRAGGVGLGGGAGLGVGLVRHLVGDLLRPILSGMGARVVLRNFRYVADSRGERIFFLAELAIREDESSPLVWRVTVSK